MAKAPHPRRELLWGIIFKTDTPSGKAFDECLLICIFLSVLAVLLESVTPIRETYGLLLRDIEWTFTILFTIEYVLRLFAVRSPIRYATSFYGVVDLLAILPTYLSLFFIGTQSLIVIRALRLLRIFRVLKLVHFLEEAHLLFGALKASCRKIIVFLGTVLTLLIIIGSLMYLIEGEEHGFTSIPLSIYWAIVTMTTVGYGDIAPQTVLGKMLASLVMITGFSIIAVPTGLVTAEFSTILNKGGTISNQACPKCAAEGHEPDAKHCKFCGTGLK